MSATGTRDDLLPWLRGCAAWVEAGMDRLLPTEDEEPRRLHAAMRYALFGGGKRLRPALCRLVCEELGGRTEDALRPAVAIELVHTYSLVHDDLPCMDDDDLRRGRPTCHVAFDEATAVLAGDALLTHAFQVLGEAGAAAGAMTAVLARAAGSLGMVGGQVLDLALEAGGEAGRAEVDRVHRLKTAALFGAACELGALAAAGPGTTLPPEGAAASPGRPSAAREFGTALGLAFQAVDDVLDVTGDAGTLGKTPGKDAALERPTLVRALGLDGARAEADRLALRARGAAAALGFGSGSRAEALVDFVLSRDA